MKSNKHSNNQIVNPVLAGLTLQQEMAIRPPDTRIRLNGRLRLPDDPTSYKIAEALVIWDPKSQSILRVLGAHIPTFKSDGEIVQGKGYYLAFQAVGDRQSIKARELPVTEFDSPTAVFLREAHLPQYAPAAHFAVIRVFSADQEVRSRIQIVGFSLAKLWMHKDKKTNKITPEVDRTTMRIIASFNNAPRFKLFNKINDRPAIAGGNFELVKEIIENLSMFSGVDLTVALSVTAKLEDTTGTLPPPAEDMDVSIESIAESVLQTTAEITKADEQSVPLNVPAEQEEEFIA